MFDVEKCAALVIDNLTQSINPRNENLLMQLIFHNNDQKISSRLYSYLFRTKDEWFVCK
jgi:hypothetical protein